MSKYLHKHTSRNSREKTYQYSYIRLIVLWPIFHFGILLCLLNYSYKSLLLYDKFILIYLFVKLCIYFENKSYTMREKEKSSIHSFTPHNTSSMVNTGPGRSWEPGALYSFPIRMPGSHVLGPSSTDYPRPLTGSWSGHGTART